MVKTNPGRFFEDYTLGETIHHAVPRTVSGGERALYHALYPARHALYSSDEFARASGLRTAPLDDLAGFAAAAAAGGLEAVVASSDVVVLIGCGAATILAIKSAVATAILMFIGSPPTCCGCGCC